MGSLFSGRRGWGYLEGYGAVNCNIVCQKTPKDAIKAPAYGLLYADNALAESLQDFNREKELGVDRDSKNLPLPVMTNDIYNISGELMGGSFRAYRSDYGHFYDNKVETHTFATDGGVDLAFGGGLQIGANLSFSKGKTSSGNWTAGDYSPLLSFKDKQSYKNRLPHSISPTLYEPFYFKMSGEQTASDLNYLKEIGDTRPVKFSITPAPIQSYWGGQNYKYTINNQLSSGAITKFEQKERTKRSTNIEYSMGATTHGRKSSHIREFSIVNATGERHTYGKTLYNHIEKEAQFSIAHQNNLASTTTTNYELGNANGTLRVGKEKLYSCTETPPYAYSYLLTQITSPDYVDVNNNGIPDDEDFGYWVKLSYADKYDANNLYAWRFPYHGANYFMGERSNQADDKGSYHYGKKEIAYIDTIETKTHQAIFHISERADALGVKNEWMGGKDNLQKLYKLDSIRLYSKAEMSTPIKTAVFEYDYELCQEIPNTTHTASGNRGKLTLKKVYFKYAASQKGTQNPYVFHYNVDNPNYNATRMDRWGNYKEDANYFEHYTTQNKADTDPSARSWLLHKIDLPEGGTIEVDYESDDYAYVQDRQAMYMAEISASSFNKETDNKYYLYFKKNEGVNAQQYVSGFKHNLMYFKMAVSYDNLMQPDYIQGYVEINPENVQNVNSTIGKVEVIPFPAYNIHPVHYLALQYLKNSRPDLMFNNSDADENQSDAAAFFRALVSGGVIDKAVAMYGNNAFYRHCVARHDYAYPKIGLAEMPSYIRLHVPDKIKYGGGSRVKAITLFDNWTKSDSSSYRQEYYYKKSENGNLISSGVAEYEPMVGAEENALRYPVYDKEKGVFFIEDEMYSEVPYGESYFPSANVGYSQVIVKTYTPENVNLSTAGIQRHEFYTAKDFPIIVSQTHLKAMINPVPNVFQLITAGFKQANSSAYSQGYMIALNNMHGQQKALSTCPFIPFREEANLIPAVETSAYTSKIEYSYHEKWENGIRTIDNKVEVLEGDGVIQKKILGQTYDFVIDQRENSSRSIGGGASAQFMLGSNWPPLIGASAMPSFDCFEESVRSVATTKVIYNTGILKETKAYNNGSVITTKNLQYDPYTGQALLTTVTNEFEQPIYHYSMPAYWSYSNMGSAAENYRAIFFNNTLLHDKTSAFAQYDKIPDTDTSKATIHSIYNNTASCWTYSSTPSVSLTGKEIVQSRKANQLNAIAASVTSLTDPTQQHNRRLPILEQFNESDTACFIYRDCAGNEKYARVVYENAKVYFFLSDNNEGFCKTGLPSLLQHFPKRIILPVKLKNNAAITEIIDYLFIKDGRTIEIRKRSNHALAGTFIWDDPKGYFSECLDGVLQASAIEYHPNWELNYNDVNIIDSLSEDQENYLGIPNIYRSLRSNLYVTERNQTGEPYSFKTNTAYDGTFNSFMFFSQAQGNAANLQNPWTWTAEITKYSPFNFEIENKNALGTYSSALYGYKNSLVTAVANNARYNEIAFDSFENDTSYAVGTQRGHLLCNKGTIQNEYAHTGKNALFTNLLQISIGESSKLQLQANKNYLFSCWVRKADCATTDNLGNDYTLYYGNSAVNIDKEAKIECWQRIEIQFTVTNTHTLLTLSSDDDSEFYVDDIRIMPANATFKSYVYNPQNYQLVAELDDNNFATFYNYDEEGILVQIKKETEQGIKTIKTTRQNLGNQTAINQ